MPELVKIPVSNADFQARFEQPQVGLMTHAASRALEAVANALSPYQFQLAYTEINASGALADQKVTCRLPERGISFQFGAQEYRFVKEGSSWSAAIEDTQVLAAAETALLTISGASVSSCKLTIAMHLQPLAKTREEMLAPFLPPPFESFVSRHPARTFGNHLKWADGEVLIDYSVGFANGIFVRFSSEFAGHPPIEEILAKTSDNQKAIFGVLDIEEASDE